MHPISLNCAEAIFEPFFAYQLSEISQWSFEAPSATGVSQVPGWAFIIFQWTARLPIRLEGGRMTIQGRRARAEFTVPEGVEAVVEHLPLMDPRRRATDEQRCDYIQYGEAHAETQPRLKLRQRSRAVTLRLEVKLIFTP